VTRSLRPFRRRRRKVAARRQDRRRSEQAGFMLHLVKPVDLDVLSQVIEG
jgi:hypothetical protein